MTAGLLVMLLGACGARHDVRMDREWTLTVSEVRLSRKDRAALPDGDIVCTLQADRRLTVVGCLGAPDAQVQALVEDWPLTHPGPPRPPMPTLGLHIPAGSRAVILFPPRRLDKNHEPLSEPLSPHPASWQARPKRSVHIQPEGLARWLPKPKTCLMGVTVSRRGEPLSVTVLDCPQRLEEEALAAAWRSRLYAARQGEERVASEATIELVVERGLR